MTSLQNQNEALIAGRKPRALIIVISLMAAYTGIFSYASIQRWASYNSTLFDLGIMIQTFHNTSQGHLLEESVNLARPVTRFWLAHWEFIYLPLSLFYMLMPRPETLLVLQSLLLALGALPVYWLARDRLHSQAAGIVFAAAYLFYPAMQNTNLFDFHGIVFATPFLLFAFYFLDKQRTSGFLFFAFLALLCREDVAIVVGMTGIYIALIKKDFKLGILVSALGALWFGMYYFGRAWMVNHFGMAEITEMTNTIMKRPSHWAYLKGGRLILDDPIYFLDEHFLTKLNLTYLLWLFVPVIFLCLASPWSLAITIPILLINMISDWYPAHVIEYPYTATLTPIIFVSAIYGLANLLQKFQTRGADIIKSRRLLLAVVLLSSIAACVAKSNLRNLADWKRTPHHEVIDRVAARIPENASLSVDTFLGPHTAERRALYIFPDSITVVDYVLYDFSNREFRLMTRDSFFLPPAMPVNAHVWQVMNDPNYGVVQYEDGVILFQRGYDYQMGLRNLAIARREEIENPAEIAVNDTLVFLGYARHDDTRYWQTFYHHFTLYWTVTKPTHRENIGQFLLSNGKDGFVSLHRPAFGLYPKSDWQPGEIVREEVYWEKRPGFDGKQVSVSFTFDDHRTPVRLFEFGVRNFSFAMTNHRTPEILSAKNLSQKQISE